MKFLKNVKTDEFMATVTRTASKYGYHYCGLDDAVHHFDSCMKFQPVHFCKGGHVGIGDFVGFERVDEK